MDIESLKKVRIPVRKAATEFIKQLVKEFDKKEAESPDLIGEIVANWLDKESHSQKSDFEILNLGKMQDIESEVERQQEYRDHIITWKIRAKRILPETESDAMNLIDRSGRGTLKCAVKLPSLQYDGNILKLNNFFSQFESAIHKNSNLSNVGNFNSLKSYLINDAEIATRGLAENSKNYEIAAKFEQIC
ncbi:hypothetical protein AVEN_155385-1 [Araneus ventricosus]|uniref:Uncharacterized protein n=1 Tax=Araneus ventricosus TaxID=182803 RepID=A0A4Y2TC03_ARAVE|nr:hypothetical protein AVEN_24707-1 [Araneus ventricosus]GBN96625.1 hypothetical protein AVEN_155385-1 [Araneus ventricosus]